MTDDQASASDSSAPALGSFAARLGHLLDAIPSPSTKRPYTDRELAELLTDMGRTVSYETVRKWRIGARQPTWEFVPALAKIFRVPLAYFADDEVAAGVDEQLATLALLRDPAFEQVAQRMQGLSRKGLEAVIALVEQVRRMDGITGEPSPED
jgi:transcriptional regulator with XRE-family HTH domain